MLLKTSRGREVERRVMVPGEVIHAPHQIDLEVSQVLRRLELSGEHAPAEAAARLELWSAIPVTRHAHVPYSKRIWELRHNVNAYDAAYVALAESLDAPLVTSDARLAGSTGHRARIELFR